MIRADSWGKKGCTHDGRVRVGRLLSLGAHPPRGVAKDSRKRRERGRERPEGGFYRLSTRAGKRAQLDGFKHGLPLFPTTSTTPCYLGHRSRVVKMERHRVRVCASQRGGRSGENSALPETRIVTRHRTATPGSRSYYLSPASNFIPSPSVSSFATRRQDFPKKSRAAFFARRERERER